MAVKIKTRYVYEDFESPGTSFEVKKDSKGRVLNPEVLSMTNQSEKDSCDINLILARFEKTGLLMDDVLGSRRTLVYGDFSDFGSYHELMSRVKKVEQVFGLLPASLRDRFGNDVANLFSFIDDPANAEEAVKLGLLDKSVLKAPEAPIEGTPPAGGGAGQGEAAPGATV